MFTEDLKLLSIEPSGGKGGPRIAIYRCRCGGVSRIRFTRFPQVTECRACHFRGQTKHGLTRRGRRHPYFSVWMGMWQRCTNPKATEYYCYGGRGITVCDRWKDFPTFVADIGPRPFGYTLERIHNDGNYEPSNCRWATRKEQANNQRHPRTKKLTATQAEALSLKYKAGGVSLRALAKECGVSLAVVYKAVRGGYVGR